MRKNQSIVADPGERAREPSTPAPVKINHDKDGSQRLLHRFLDSPFSISGSASSPPCSE